MDVILPMKVYIKMSAPQLGDRFEKRGDLNYNHKAICMKDIYIDKRI